MKNKSKFFAKKERHNYMADKIFINHYARIDKYPEFPEVLDRKKSLRVPQLKRWLKITPFNDRYTQISFQTAHNLNLIARNLIKNDLGINRTYTKSKIGENFIPLYYRKCLNIRHISITKIRDKAIDQFFSELEYYQELVFSVLLDEHDCFIDTESFFTSVEEIEVNYDIQSPLGINYAQTRKIKESISQNTKRFTIGNYIDSKGHREILSEIKDSNESHCESGIGIKGYCFDDSSYGIYLKEQSKYGNLNRIERRFKKQQIQKIAKNTFNSKCCFKLLLKTLSMETYKTFMKPLNKTLTMTPLQYKRVVKEYCHKFFGANYQEAYLSLTKGKKAILTGKNGESSDAVARKAKKLANDKTFIRKKKGVRGYYEVDKNWIRYRFKK